MSDINHIISKIDNDILQLRNVADITEIMVKADSDINNFDTSTDNITFNQTHYTDNSVSQISKCISATTYARKVRADWISNIVEYANVVAKPELSIFKETILGLHDQELTNQVSPFSWKPLGTRSAPTSFNSPIQSCSFPINNLSIVIEELDGYASIFVRNANERTWKIQEFDEQATIRLSDYEYLIEELNKYLDTGIDYLRNDAFIVRNSSSLCCDCKNLHLLPQAIPYTEDSNVVYSHLTFDKLLLFIPMNGRLLTRCLPRLGLKSRILDGAGREALRGEDLDVVKEKLLRNHKRFWQAAVDWVSLYCNDLANLFRQIGAPVYLSGWFASPILIEHLKKTAIDNLRLPLAGDLTTWNRVLVTSTNEEATGGY